MNNQFKYLFYRDVKKTLSLRTVCIWGCMSAICVFFFFTSSGRYDLVENGKVDFMVLMLPQIIFGAWAVLSVYFDLVSADREHNVLDCILCSGVKKNKLFFSKVLTSIIVSLILSMIYLLPITAVIIGVSGQASYFTLSLKYLLPLWGYIMVFASFGLTISIIARSSKTAMIWSLASGLILMPRFFMIIVDGIGSMLKWTQTTKNTVSMISPGISMEALSDFSNITRLTNASVIFSVCIIICLSIAFRVFRKQDELNYGE